MRTGSHLLAAISGSLFIVVFGGSGGGGTLVVGSSFVGVAVVVGFWVGRHSPPQVRINMGFISISSRSQLSSVAWTLKINASTHIQSTARTCCPLHDGVHCEYSPAAHLQLPSPDGTNRNAYGY